MLTRFGFIHQRMIRLVGNVHLDPLFSVRKRKKKNSHYTAEKIVSRHNAEIIPQKTQIKHNQLAIFHSNLFISIRQTQNFKT